MNKFTITDTKGLPVQYAVVTALDKDKSIIMASLGPVANVTGADGTCNIDTDGIAFVNVFGAGYDLQTVPVAGINTIVVLNKPGEAPVSPVQPFIPSADHYKLIVTVIIIFIILFIII